MCGADYVTGELFDGAGGAHHVLVPMHVRHAALAATTF
jgi:hypothetical protein